MEWKPEIKDSEFVPQKKKPTEETVCYKIGSTHYEVPTSCGGSKRLRLSKYAADNGFSNRDYLKVGCYTEIFFVERDVRYIAINDGADSAKGNNDFTPFRNLFNDFYAKDTSKKVRAIKRAQEQAGEHLTKPPYGYMVSPTDKKQWIIGEETAAVMKWIFDLCIAGKDPMQITKILKEDKVLTAKAHYAKKEIHFPTIPMIGEIVPLSVFGSAWTTVGIG